MAPRGLAFILLALALAACSVDPKPAPSPAATLSNVPEPATAPAAPTLAKNTATAKAADDADSSSSTSSSSLRDPFAPSTTPALAPPPRDDIPRKARKYSIDQLRLVAIVSGSVEEPPRAMLIDPKGKGWIVSRGDHVGRPDLVTDHVAGWRVSKIKSDEIVLVREDMARGEAAAAPADTRVIALHTNESAPADADD